MKRVWAILYSEELNSGAIEKTEIVTGIMSKVEQILEKYEELCCVVMESVEIEKPRHPVKTDYSVKELNNIIQALGLNAHGCIEKQDLKLLLQSHGYMI